MIVEAIGDLRRRLDAGLAEQPVVRILARLSSLAISDDEDWPNDPDYQRLLIEERDSLRELIDRGAMLRAILTWRGGSEVENFPQRRQSLLKYCKAVQKKPKVLDRVRILPYSTDERNQLFLGDEFLFVGRKRHVTPGFDATEMIRDQDIIKRESQMFDTLLDNGIQSLLEQLQGKKPKDERARKLLVTVQGAARTEGAGRPWR